MADPAYIDADGVLTDGEAWVALATATIDPAAIVTFTSTDDGQVGDWSQYMDLVIVAYARGSRSFAEVGMYLNFNNDTGTNYTRQQLKGSGAAVSAYSSTGRTNILCGDMPAATATANQFGVCIIQISDINSGKYKAVFSQNAADRDGAGWVELQTGAWQSQSPITEIDIADSSGAVWAVGSKFSLFGVLPRMVS